MKKAAKLLCMTLVLIMLALCAVGCGGSSRRSSGSSGSKSSSGGGLSGTASSLQDTISRVVGGNTSKASLVDKAVSKGSITKSEGNQIKKNLQLQILLVV